MRDADKINADLADSPLPEGYVQIPIFEYNNGDINDDVSTDGCSYIIADNDVNYGNNTLWD